MKKNVVVVGGVALGSKAASRFKRLAPQSKVTMIDQDRFVSYGGCGIPYYVSGDVSDVADLRKTSFHMLRDESFFRNCKDIDVLTQTTVTAIDRENKRLHVQTKNGESQHISYDNLVLGTGSRPRRIDVDGIDLPGVFTVSNLRDAEKIKSEIVSGQVERAVIVGGGFIGLEMAEALADMWEIDIALVEYCDQIMPGLVSPTFARMAQYQMESHGVKFYLGEGVRGITGEKTVTGVITDHHRLDADLVILAIGVEPNVDLARAAGLHIGRSGGVSVDEHLRTSDPDIFAGGDCAEIRSLLTGQPMYMPLGSLANRQGRVIGTNLAGGNAVFKGAVGSFAVKVFDAALAGSGLNIGHALASGFNAVSVQVAQLDRAHFYPTKEMMHLELVVEKNTRRILGIQGFGKSGDAIVGRINTVAALLENRPTLDQISNLEVAYSPPFSAAMDILNALANTAENYLDGRYRPLDAAAFEDKWRNGNGHYVVLDCRDRNDGEAYSRKYPERWLNIPQDELRLRENEIPRDKELILLCNTGVRSYESQLNLSEMGITTPMSVQGGIVTLKKYGLDI